MKDKFATKLKKIKSKQVHTMDEKPFFKHDPVTTIFAVLTVFFASQIIAGTIVAVYPAIKNWSADQGSEWLNSSVYAQFFYILLAEIFAVWLVLKLLKAAKVKKTEIGLIKPSLTDVIYGFSGYAVYFFSYLAVIVVASKFSSFIDLDQKQDIGFDGASGSQLYFVFASLVILPPIAEEIMFRGFLFTSFRRKYKLVVAMVMTSLLFGVAHLQFGNGAPLLWVAAIDTFVLSMVLCYIRERTGSIWGSIMLHTIKNGMAFIAIFYAKF